jgi:predicted transcriptional regulator
MKRTALGGFLQDKRNERGLTQMDMAGRTGFAQSKIAAFEVSRIPNARDLAVLFSALSLTSSERLDAIELARED